MGTIRQAITAIKHGGYDAFGNPLSIVRETWVDVPAPENPLPADTPTFMRVADDPSIVEAEAAYAVLREETPKAKEAVEAAKREYESVRAAYVLGRATMEDVEEAAVATTRAEARSNALEHGLNPARRMVAESRKEAVQRGTEAFTHEAGVLAQERAALLEQVKLIDESYTALRHSFRQSGNIAASFVPASLDSLANSGTGYEDALRRYAYSGLETEAAPDIEPRNIILSWQTQR